MTNVKSSAGDPIRVVFIDHSYLHQIGWAEKFARSTSGLHVILLTDKLPSRQDGSFEVVNVRDVAQNQSLEALQAKFNFPLYRALVAERAYFDYTTFRQSECYSRVTLDDVGKLVSQHVNALDEIVRTRADLVIGHLADNAIAAIAAHVSEHYGKPYAAEFPFYWWPDGCIFVDRADQTSSQVDALYERFYRDQTKIDRDRLTQVYHAKRVSHTYLDNVVYALGARIRKIFGSRDWHDPFSPLNWIVRRAAHIVSTALIAGFTSTMKQVPAGTRYLLYPLHVVPEASLLGSTPELADQFSLIKNISINLPWGVRLYVKRHPGQKKWTGPGFSFFRSLEALKNVDVIDAGVSTNDMLRDPNCLGVATVNGTVGLEGAFQRKPVFVFGKAIYGVAHCFFKPKTLDEFREQMLLVAKGRFQFDEGAMWAIMAALDGAVWHGNNDYALNNTAEEASLGSFSMIEAYIRSESWRKPVTSPSAIENRT